MSGSAFCEWAFSASNRVVNVTEQIAHAVGCGNSLTNSSDLKDCLKQKTVEEIQAATGKIVCIFLLKSYKHLGI